MAQMTPAQITAELQRKAAAGETKASNAANQAQLDSIIKQMNAPKPPSNNVPTPPSNSGGSSYNPNANNLPDTKVGANGQTMYRIGDTYGTYNPNNPNQAQISQMQHQVQNTGTVSDYYAGAFGINNQAPTMNYYTPPKDNKGNIDYTGLTQSLGKTSMNTAQMSDGRLLDTTGFTAQQSHAATLMDEVKAGKRTQENAMAILTSMGLDNYGNAIPGLSYSNATPNYSSNVNAPLKVSGANNGSGSGASLSAQPTVQLSNDQKAYFDRVYGGVNNYVASQQNRYNQAYAAGDQETMNKLSADLARFGVTPSSPVQSNQQGTNEIDFNNYRTESATIDDIAAKWGFDYSRDYANRQAEAEAQAKRNAYNQNLRLNESQKNQTFKQIEQGVYNAADKLDASQFLAQLETAQGQTNSGLNAGIAGDQNLRLAMNAQNQLGGIYGDANLARNAEQTRFTNEMLKTMENLALTEQEKLAYADALYNQRRQEGFNNAMTVNQFSQNENLALLQAAMNQRGQNISMDQFDRSFDWSKMMDTIGATGKLPSAMGGGLSVQEQQRQFENDMATKAFDRPYEQLTAYEKAQIGIAKTRAAEAGGKAGALGGTALSSLNSTMLDSVLKAHKEADPTNKQILEAMYPELKVLQTVNAVDDDAKTFVSFLDPANETLSQVKAELLTLQQSREISREQREKYEKLAEEYFRAWQTEQARKNAVPWRG